MSIMHGLIGVDLGQVHKTGNLNYRLWDYNTDTADPASENGCGSHTDYGTFTIIFQDGTSGLEIEHAEQPGLWVPVPGDSNGCPRWLVRCDPRWRQHPSYPS
jgi:isopenicillin N synthase-like dioxygenase